MAECFAGGGHVVCREIALLSSGLPPAQRVDLMRRFSLFPALMVITSFLGSNSLGNAALAEEQGAETPDAAARQFVEALKERDRKAYAAVMLPGALADNVFEFAVAAERFKEKMIKAYGEVGWKNFQDSEGARITLAYNEMNLDDLEFKTEGDRATGSLPEDGEVLHVARKEGRWFIDLDATFDANGKEGGMTAKSFGKALAGMTEAIRDGEKKIGEGTTVDQLDKEMGAAFLATLVSAGAKPKVSIQAK